MLDAFHKTFRAIFKEKFKKSDRTAKQKIFWNEVILELDDEHPEIPQSQSIDESTKFQEEVKVEEQRSTNEKQENEQTMAGLQQQEIITNDEQIAGQELV